MKTKTKLFILTILFLTLTSKAQTFTEQTGISLAGVYDGSVDWGDYDNDGDLDILLTGTSSSVPISKIYKNNGNNSFTEQTGISLTGVSSSSGIWGDYDNDGDLDILLTGYNGSIGVSKIYKNNGNNSFIEQTGIGLPGVYGGAIAWGDYDNDGDLDILLTGASTGSSNSAISKIFKNNGNNSFTEQTSINLIGVLTSSVAWGDYDNDGDLDILLTGYSYNFGQISQIYRNNGNNSFTAQSGIGLNSVSSGSVAWGDYDNDGDLDILLTGHSYTSYVSKIFKNNGNNSFAEQTSISLTGVYYSSVAWGDYDNDGDLDILLTGNTGNQDISKIYKNNGNNSFAEQLSISLTGESNSSVAWGDYDNDGDLDILFTGASVTKIYKNNSFISNTSPTIPTNINFISSNSSITWFASTDDKTISISLTYNVARGTTNSNENRMPSHSFFDNGKRKLAAMGNQQLDTIFYISDLKYDSSFYFRVQAIDNGFKGSAFSSPLYIEIPPYGDLPNDTSILCGNSKQLDIYNINGNPNNLTYTWFPSNGLSDTSIRNPIAKPSITTMYKVTIISPLGKVFTDSILITVASITVNTGIDKIKLCGDSVFLNPTTNYAGLASNLNWSWNPSLNLSSSFIKNPMAKPSTTTNYIVNLSSTEGCQAVDTIKITITPATLNAGSDKTIVCGAGAQITPTLTYGGIQSQLLWSWSPGSGLNDSLVKSPIAKPISTKTFVGSFTSPNGCIAQDSIKIIVNPMIVDAGSAINLACGASVTLNPSINYGGYISNLTYNWSPNSALSNPAIKNPIANPLTTTKYFLNVSSIEGCFGTDSITILSVPLQITANNLTKTCGPSAQIYASINSNSTSLNYTWSPSIGLSNPNILNPTVNPIYTTTYIVNAVDGACTATDTAIVTVNTANWNPDFSVNQTLFTAPPFAVQYTNNTANPNNYNFSWDFGDGTILNSNNPSVFHTYAFNGLYSVSLIATHKTNSCPDSILKMDYIYCTGGPTCTYLVNINQNGPINKCQFDSVLLTCNTDASFSYQWKLNGVAIQGATNPQLYAHQTGAYTVSISQTNGCYKTSTAVQVNFTNLTPPVILKQGVINPCSSDSAKLYTAQTYASYLWSTGSTSPFIYVKLSGNYILTVSDANGCSANSLPFVINTSYLTPQSICIVGVKPLLNKNEIAWNKPVSSSISAYKIYKESNAADDYFVLATQPYSQMSSFVDNASSPEVKADRYKITAVDTCGNETPMSNYHKTNHLTINKGTGTNWNLIWDGYEGFSFPSYNIYRGTNLANLSLISTIQSNLTSYTDNPGNNGKYFYQIEVVNPSPCNPSKAVVSSFSNIVATIHDGINDQSGNEINVDLFPNPNQGDFTLSIKNASDKNYKISINSVVGDIVYIENFDDSGTNFTKNIHLNNIAKGLYFVCISSENGKVIKRIIIE